MPTLFEPFFRKVFRRIVDNLLWRYRYHRWRFSLSEYFTDPGRIPVQSPIFLLGTQGSGLTLISRVLRRHRSVVSVTGNHRYWAGADEMQNVLSGALPDELRLEGHSILEEQNLPTSWLYATDRFLPHFRCGKEDADERLKSIFLQAIRKAIYLYGSDIEQPRFVDKSQTYTLKVSFLAELLEDRSPRFLLVTRNPYALCYRSATKSRGIQQEASSKREGLRLAAEHWKNSISCALDDGKRLDHFEVIRFEDFLSQPGKQLNVLSEAIGLPLDSSLLPQPDDTFPLGTTNQTKWYPLDPSVNEDYLESIREEDVRFLQDRIGKFAEEFDYTPEGP